MSVSLDLDHETLTAVKKSYSHGYRQHFIERSQICLLLTLVIIYGIQQFLFLINIDLNATTKTSIVKESSYPMPYWFINSPNFLDHINVTCLNIHSPSLIEFVTYNEERSCPSDINIETFTVLDIDDFIETMVIETRTMQSDTKWRQYRFATDAHPNTTVDTVLLIPPKDAVLEYGTQLTINIDTELRYSSVSPYDPGFFQYTHQFKHAAYTYGEAFGLLWYMDHTSKIHMDDIISKRFLDFEYIFAPSKVGYQISLSVSRDNRTDKNDANYFYETKKVSDIIDIYRNIHENSENVTNNLTLYIRTYLAFTISPKGDGAITFIDTIPQKTFLDVLGGIGGLFTTLSGIIGVIIAFMAKKQIFGLFGCTKEEGFDDDNKRKAALYLQEIGIISKAKYDAITEYYNKQMIGCFADHHKHKRSQSS